MPRIFLNTLSEILRVTVHCSYLESIILTGKLLCGVHSAHTIMEEYEQILVDFDIE